MSESKRGPGRPPKREIGPDGVRLFKDVPADDVQAVEVEEVPAIVKAVAAIFTNEPVKQVRNLTRESIAVSRGTAVAAKMVQ